MRYKERIRQEGRKGGTLDSSHVLVGLRELCGGVQEMFFGGCARKDVAEEKIS
jgi:hypothetical protein